MKKDKSNMKIYGILGISTILLFMLIYNDQRIYGNYNFSFLYKDVSINLVPFKNFRYLIENLGGSIVIKIVYFAIIGFLLKLTLSYFHLNNRSHFILLSSSIVISTELLVVMSSGFLPIPIDVNNIICYFIGLWTGLTIHLIYLKFIHTVAENLEVRL